jgi:hypothetical protein
MKLIQHNYGKAKVRVLKVLRAEKNHSTRTAGESQSDSAKVQPRGRAA